MNTVYIPEPHFTAGVGPKTLPRVQWATPAKQFDNVALSLPSAHRDTSKNRQSPTLGMGLLLYLVVTRRCLRSILHIRVYLERSL